MDEWVWSNGGMILTGETEVLGEKHYIVWVVDEWIWSNGGMILTGETDVLGEKHYTVWVLDEWMSMEQWWNDTVRGKWKFWVEHLSQRHFAHQNSYMDRRHFEPDLPRWHAGDWPFVLCQGPLICKRLHIKYPTDTAGRTKTRPVQRNQCRFNKAFKTLDCPAENNLSF